MGVLSNWLARLTVNQVFNWLGGSNPSTPTIFIIMETLKTQYKNYLKSHPDSQVNFEYWKEKLHLFNLKSTMINLSDNDMELFISKIESPDPPNEELKRAFSNYKKFIDE
jgi:hypothetical protein